MAASERSVSTHADGWDTAQSFYETELLPKLLPSQKGCVLVLDLVSRDYAIGVDLNEADSRLKMRHPNCFGYAFRIGYRTVGSLGGGTIREIEP